MQKNGEAGLKCKGKQLNQVSDLLSFSRLKGTICRMFYDLVECQDHYMYTAVWWGYWSALMWNDYRGWDLSYSCRSWGVFLWLLRPDGESLCYPRSLFFIFFFFYFFSSLYLDVLYRSPTVPAPCQSADNMRWQPQPDTTPVYTKRHWGGRRKNTTHTSPIFSHRFQSVSKQKNNKMTGPGVIKVQRRLQITLLPHSNKHRGCERLSPRSKACSTMEGFPGNYTETCALLFSSLYISISL